METASSYLTVLPSNERERDKFFDKLKGEILNDTVDKRVIFNQIVSTQDLINMLMEDPEIFEKLNS